MSCTGPRLAPSQQPAVLEEHVARAPRARGRAVSASSWRDERIVARRHERPLGARPARTRPSGSPRPRASGQRREPRRRRRTRSRCRPASATSSACASSGPPSLASPSAGSARLPTITGWTNSTATWRTSERACGVAAERQQPPAAREALGHPVAQPRDAVGLGARRSARSPRLRARAAARRPASVGGAVRHAGAASRVRRPPRASRGTSLDALARPGADEHVLDAGVDLLEVAEEAVDVEVEVRQQVDLVERSPARRCGTSAGT